MAGDEEMRLGQEAVDPPGELIHLPGPSYLPVVLAGGLTIAIVGVVIWWVLVLIGGLISLYVILRWLGETRQEISELPLEH